MKNSDVIRKNAVCHLICMFCGSPLAKVYLSQVSSFQNMCNKFQGVESFCSPSVGSPKKLHLKYVQSDEVNLELPITKANTYGFFVLPALKTKHRKQKQRVQVSDSYSLWQDILFGVHKPQFWILFCLTYSLQTYFLH